MTKHQPAGIPIGGQFAPTAHAEPGIVLTGSRPEYVSDQSLFNRELAARNIADLDLYERYPDTKSEAKRLLKNSRGEADGMVRAVHLDYTNSPESKPGDHVEVVGPKDGRPIIIDITSGLPNLKVTSGTAIIRTRSGWGNSVDVGPGAEAIIIAPADAKTTVECEEGGKVTFVCPTEKNRFRPFGKGEIFLATGTDTDRIPYERPVYEPYPFTDEVAEVAADSSSDDESNQVFAFEVVGDDIKSYDVENLGEGNYSLRSEDGKSFDFQHNGDPEDHHSIQDKAVKSMKLLGMISDDDRVM